MLSNNLVPRGRTESTSLINSCPSLKASLLRMFGSGLYSTGFRQVVKDEGVEKKLQFDLIVPDKASDAIAALSLSLAGKSLGGCSIRLAEGLLSNGEALCPDELERLRKFCGRAATGEGDPAALSLATATISAP